MFLLQSRGSSTRVALGVLRAALGVLRAAVPSSFLLGGGSCKVVGAMCCLCALCMCGTDSVSGSARGPLPLGGRDSQGGEEAGRGDHCHACGGLKCRVAGAVCSGR